MLAWLVGMDLPWDRVHVWQVDERVAPDGDPARNAVQLDAFPGTVHAMSVTSVDLRGAARRYGAGLPTQFDVVHLGIGDDGHTASWPPGDDDVVTSSRAVELVPEFNGFVRMTFTPRVVNAARTRIVLATGITKAPMVERWLLGDTTLPVTRVHRTATVICLDAAAAPDRPATKPD